MTRTRSRPARRAITAAALASLALAATVASANGVDIPSDVDRPIPAAPAMRLPFPVVEERAPNAPSLVGLKDLPSDPALLSLPNFANGTRQDDALGTSLRHFEAVVVRQSHVAQGKLELGPSSVGYLVEAAPGASTLAQATLYVAGTPRTLIDFDQSIVTRKDVAIGPGESVVLGSTVLTYDASWPLAGTLSVGISTSSLAGFEWGRVGIGAFEVSLNQPSWLAKTFRHGFEQGRLDEVTPKFVRFGWLSSTRTDSITVADKEERAGSVKAGDEFTLTTGAKIRVTGVDGGARRVRLETPEGPKVLSVDDPKRLIEDTEMRRKLIAIGKDFAIVCIPARSEFTKNEAYIGVYSKLHVYKNGEAFDEDPRFRTYPIAFPSGLVLGVYLVNDKVVELKHDAPTFSGPAKAFKLVTSWGTDGTLESYGIDDAKGGQSARVLGKGRTSIDLLAGGGPTIESLRGHVAKIEMELAGAPAAATAPAAGSASPPAASPPPPEAAQNLPIRSPADFVAAARPHSRWMLGGLAAGFIIAMLLGAFRRRRPTYLDD